MQTWKNILLHGVPELRYMPEKRKNRKSSFEKAVKWIAVSIAVIAGIKITGSAWCLWAFALPVMAD